MKTEVLLERYPYRYVQSGTIELNGIPTIEFKSSMNGLNDTKTCIF